MTFSSPSARLWPFWLAVLVIWLLVALPMIRSDRTFFFRDVFFLHLPLKAFGAEQLKEGRVPAFNPTWGLGQTFRGNPNALPFYPGNLLYLALPFWSAFNLHYLLHWLLAMLAMNKLALELGQTRSGALMAGLTYAGSGWIMSCLTSYNLLTVAAWWPIALWGAARGGLKGIALGGLACGLALLGGEPVTAALGLVPLLLVSVERHGWRRGLKHILALGGVSLGVALPQLVATARVLGFTFRGGHGMLGTPQGFYAFHPLRLLELLVPLPFGWPGDLAQLGFWGHAFVPRLPLIITAYSGIVGLWLMLAGSSRRRAWALLAAGGLALGWLSGLPGLKLVVLSGGLVRYPEKFLFWTALAVALLAGWGLDRLVAVPGRWTRIALWAGGCGLGLAAALLLYGPRMAARLAPYVEEHALPGKAATQVALWIVYLALGGGLLILAALGLRRRRLGWVLAAQLLALLQLAPLVLTEPTAPYRVPPPWAKRVAPATAVVSATSRWPLGVKTPPYHFSDTSMAMHKRVGALDLNRAAGVLHGLSYPFAPDVDGMHTPLSSFMLINLRGLDWDRRVNWLRATGTEIAVLVDIGAFDSLTLLAEEDRFGVATRLYRVEHPAGPVWWPPELVVGESPIEAFRLVTRAPDPVTRVVVPKQIDQDPQGRVRLLAWEPDHIEFEVESRGGVAVVRRAFQPLFVARGADRRFATMPVNLCLMGVEVPPGRHRVVLSVSSWPEMAAGALALLIVAAALAVGLWRR